MKTMLFLAALLISATTSAQLTTPTGQTERIARTLTSIELNRVIAEGDTAYFIVYKNGSYPSLNDFRTLHTGNHSETLAFLNSLLTVFDTGKHKEVFYHENPTAMIVRQRSNIIISPEEHNWFYFTRANIMLFWGRMGNPQAQ